jgi:hypothetical protein
MDTKTIYTTGLGPVNWGPLRGRYLRRSLRNKNEAAFTAADLYRGIRQLVEPSLAQAAFLAGSDVTAVWWALHREEYRGDIIVGLMPYPGVAGLGPAPGCPRHENNGAPAGRCRQFSFLQAAGNITQIETAQRCAVAA